MTMETTPLEEIGTKHINPRYVEILESWLEGEGVDPKHLYEQNKKWIEEV